MSCDRKHLFKLVSRETVSITNHSTNFALCHKLHSKSILDQQTFETYLTKTPESGTGDWRSRTSVLACTEASSTNFKLSTWKFQMKSRAHLAHHCCVSSRDRTSYFNQIGLYLIENFVTEFHKKLSSFELTRVKPWHFFND